MNYVYGTSAAEVMFATDGPDIIIGGGGSDAIHGGFGKDVFVLDEIDIKEFIIDFEDGRDLIDLRQLGIESFAELVQLFEYDTDIVESVVSDIRLYVNLMQDPEGRVDLDPSDFIYVDTPVRNYTDADDNVIVRHNVYSAYFGNGGVDTLDLRHLARDSDQPGVSLVMDGDRFNTGSFELNGVEQHFFEFANVHGTLGMDTITGSLAANVLSGRAGNDVISGSAGNDVLFGNNGNDRLDGGSGMDRLIGGGGGNDTVTGGQGADTFVFHGGGDGVDRVTDFEDGLDRLDVSSWGVSSMSQLSITANGDGTLTVAARTGDLSFIVGGADGDSLTVSDLNGNDFIFA